jgi:1-deoxy-D-xylulose-5-phosphate synthase
MRVFPNIAMMAPGDASEMEPMLEFALNHKGPTSIRYPKTTAPIFERPVQPIQLGKSEVIRWGTDGAIVACGATLQQCIGAADLLKAEGLNVAVINARFIKPLDTALLGQLFDECRFLVTVEEGALMGGFGSAVLEAACQHGWDTRIMRTLGIPDRFIEHGDRNDLLADLGLDPKGIAKTCQMLNEKYADASPAGASV